MRKCLVVLALVLAACSGTDVTPPSASSIVPGETAATPGATVAPDAPDTTASPDTSVTSAPSPAPANGSGCWAAPPGDGTDTLSLTDVTEQVGLIDPLTGMHGHASVWTDANGDGLADLFVGTFADRDTEIYQERGASGPSPDRLLTLDGATFTTDPGFPEAFSRSSGGATADLDNDGDLDLVVSRNIKEDEVGPPPTQIYENDGGSFQPVGTSDIPEALGGRAVGVLDYDQDGLYDLVITEDRWTGGSTLLLHNEGDLVFRNATNEAGLPGDAHGLGLAVADFNNDGATDLFVAGSNRLFFSDGTGGFTEQDSSVFEWEFFSEEDDAAGVSAADVNRDGWIDLTVGQHFNSTVEDGEQVAVRLYLNQGDGTFVDVTDEAGLTPLPTKAPHVELADLNNDGWPDLLTSASADGGPAVFMHEGLEGTVPRFSTPEGLGDQQYWVGAPTVDFDRDGRLDVFLLEWEPALPSLLLHNETDAGNWLEVSVDGDNGYGIGWRVEVLNGDELIGSRDITVTEGYSSGVLPVAHFGLGPAETVTVRLTPPGSDAVQLTEVAANQRIRWPSC